MILPRPTKTLFALIGPFVIFVALSLSGGELLLRPDLIGRYGLRLLWIVPIILILQFSVNLEIERYTAVTGGNTVAGLVGLAPFLRYVFSLAIIISLMWPAWIATAGNVLAAGLGFSKLGAGLSFFLLLFILLIWQNKKSYFLLERFAKVGLILVFIIIIVALGVTFQISHFVHFFSGPWFPQSVDKIPYLSALAYGGVAGVLNLAQSGWIKKRGYAAAGVSTSEKIDWNDEESKKSFKIWWSLIKREHFLLFGLGNLLGIFLLSVLAAFLLAGSNAHGFGVLLAEIFALNQSFPFLGLVFSVGVFLVFLLAQMSILDAAGNLLKECWQINLSADRLAQLVGLIGVMILGLTIFIPRFNQPATLLHISAVASAAVMALYPPLLLYLNRGLPKFTKSKFNAGLVILCSLFYGGMVVWSLL